MDDPHGYARLTRSLVFLRDELLQHGHHDQATEVSRALTYACGSPSEYLGESRIVLRCVASTAPLPASILAFASSLADEIDEGFRRVG